MYVESGEGNAGGFWSETRLRLLDLRLEDCPINTNHLAVALSSLTADPDAVDPNLLYEKQTRQSDA